MVKRIQLSRFWAKSAHSGDYHSVPAHLLDVAAAGTSYLRRNTSLLTNWSEALSLKPAGLETFLGWGLAIHDIGKFCDRFQGCHPELFEKLWPGKVRRAYIPHHTTLGSLFLKHTGIPHLATRLAADHPWSPREWRHVLSTLQPPFTGHHGEPPAALDFRPDHWDDEGTSAATQWLTEIDPLFPLSTLWKDGPAAEDIVDTLRVASWHIAGFAVLSDWIGSNEAWFHATSEPFRIESYWDSALATATRAIPTTGILPTTIASPLTMAEMFGKPPTPLQQHIESWTPAINEPHLMIMEETTGSGKTEASLLAAHRIMNARGGDGFYFALPTQATANAMYSRLQEGAHRVFEHASEASLVLAHSGRLAMKEFRQAAISFESTRRDDSGRLECAEWLADSRKKAFLAHVGVGTIDQALLGVLAVKHQSLRIFGLTTRVLIVDEVHAYDSYATQLLETLIRFHTRAGGSTILLSATMPQKLRTRFVNAFSEELEHPSGESIASTAYPLVTIASRAGLVETPLEPRKECEREIRLSFKDDFEDVVQFVRSAAAKGQNVCWIRNTVAEAIDAWHRLADVGASVFHSRFMEGDRNRIECDVLDWAGPDSKPEQRRGRVLVATQVVEQSLDVDFDVLITDLAPVELIIQRAGRLHRHADRVRATSDGPTLTIFSPQWDDQPSKEWVRNWSPGSAAVYPDAGRMWLTLNLLRQADRLRIPSDMRPLVEAVYGKDSEPAIPKSLLEATRQAEAEDLAQGTHASAKQLRLDEGYRLRNQKWESPDRGRTRAGEPSVDLHLVVEANGKLIPLETGPDRWQASRVKLGLKMAQKEGLLEGPPSEILGVANLVVLTPLDSTSWTGRTAGTHGNFTIHYTRTAGLSITQEE